MNVKINFVDGQFIETKLHEGQTIARFKKMLDLGGLFMLGSKFIFNVSNITFIEFKDE